MRFSEFTEVPIDALSGQYKPYIVHKASDLPNSTDYEGLECFDLWLSIRYGDTNEIYEAIEHLSKLNVPGSVVSPVQL